MILVRVFLCNVRKLWVVKIFRKEFYYEKKKIKGVEILRFFFFFRKFYIFSQHAVVVNQNSNRHFFRIEIKNCKY